MRNLVLTEREVKIISSSLDKRRRILFRELQRRENTTTYAEYVKLQETLDLLNKTQSKVREWLKEWQVELYGLCTCEDRDNCGYAHSVGELNG